jgi:hypothetical protein
MGRIGKALSGLEIAPMAGRSGAAPIDCPVPGPSRAEGPESRDRYRPFRHPTARSVLVTHKKVTFQAKDCKRNDLLKYVFSGIYDRTHPIYLRQRAQDVIIPILGLCAKSEPLGLQAQD